MTRQTDGERERTEQGRTEQGETRGEVVISGLDTGPSREERENITPTDEHARLQPLLPRKEPTDEDG